MSRYPQVGFGQRVNYNQEKAQQIQEVQRNFPYCQVSESLISVPVQTPHGQQLQLQAILTRDFPKDAPSVNVVGSVDHPLINKNGQFTQLHSFSSWKYGSSTLYQVMREAYETIMGRSHAPQTMDQHSQSIPNEFPQLAALSTEELTKLLTDPQAYKLFAEKVITELQIDKSLTDMKQAVVQQATDNLEKEEEMKGLKNAIAVVRSSEYLPAKEQFDGRAARQRAIMSTFDPEILKTRLASAAQRLEEESEALLQRFLEKEIPLDAFLEEYQERRREFHMKDIKFKTALQTIK
eukprot:TRINITY_DN3700_c0_g2_i1.p1 TRINITY_DN3700_c0_g2~~TRINITY_DN3700_c0_g2_i1.p1  ORF type:complete len:326 (-),score=53.08 TRINITY_DN3700_c0_g2_i1:229-1107(-)